MDCVVLFESKLSVTDAAFGQVVRYLRRLFPTGSASAVLFDLSSFWLITSLKTVILRVEKANWVDGGSKALFESFVSDHTSPWVRRLTTACSALGVDVVEGGAFLGRGAHGRVFKVERKADKKVLALKLVDSRSTTALFREELALTNAELTGLTARLEHGFVDFPGGAALLVTPVGAPLPRPTTLQEVFNLFDLLRQLHEKNIIHGDPRVPNVIVVKDNDKDKLLWIDLVEAVLVTPGFRTTDAAILTRSILRLLHTSLLGEPLESLINEYGQAPTNENMLKVATVSGLLRNKLKTAEAWHIRADNKVRSIDRPVALPAVEESVLAWVLKCEELGVCITGELIRKQASATCDQMNVPVSQRPAFSKGWLYKFQVKHGLTSKLQHGEAASVSPALVAEGRQQMKAATSGYSAANTYNMDETAFFFCLSPHRSITRHRQPGTKKSKKRITVALTTNADGTDVVDPLFIGTAARTSGGGNVVGKGCLAFCVTGNRGQLLESDRHPRH
ncbi:hypothetical protein DYB34_011656 [Aphanomyces astaci]|uniref:HTH CENPB-type domain-containing protein n=1 Tax=Aphanomyces astaci TaxID=112090 RepID=A0A3R6ZG45_APHAT|nr:hypothetical protein DYB34_011656 [Aphanomyces astaci]